MKRWGCIIFDCDGVLVDSVAISNRVLAEMLAPYGTPKKFGQAIKNFQSGSLRACLQEVQRCIDTQLPDDFEKVFRKKTFEAFEATLEPVAGVTDLISRLTVPYCVASSGPPEKIRLTLGITQLLEKFEGRIFSSYDIQRWKPDPGLFIHAATRMGFEPGHCVVIEDSLDGIRAARAGGFDVFGFVNKTNEPLFRETGAPLFFSMEELAGHLL